MSDAMGDRTKMYEMAEAGRKFTPLLPIVARLDGKGFSSKFTHGLARPYDERLSNLMVETVKHLVEETAAVMGYTQSDEITLAVLQHHGEPDLLRRSNPEDDQFWRRSVRFTSTSCFPSSSPKRATRNRYLTAVWQLPTLDEGANAFLWREFDATKNSLISMAAQEFYSHKELIT
jgi:tRNA(His) 5'-end guanylyltransferase